METYDLLGLYLDSRNSDGSYASNCIWLLRTVLDFLLAAFLAHLDAMPLPPESNLQSLKNWVLSMPVIYVYIACGSNTVFYWDVALNLLLSQDKEAERLYYIRKAHIISVRPTGRTRTAIIGSISPKFLFFVIRLLLNLLAPYTLQRCAARCQIRTTMYYNG
jgi:hypothetical protein